MTLPPGVYQLNVSTSSLGASNYAFRLLDQSTAVPLASGQVVEGRFEPSGEMVAYSVDADAGDRLFVDFRDLTARTYAYDPVVGQYRYNYTGGVRIVDPYGRDVTNIALGDAEVVATVSGRYTVLLDGYYAADVAAAYRLAVFVNKPGQPRVIDLNSTATAMDLAVQEVAVAPAAAGAAIASGTSISVSWRTTNQGISTTLGDFSERVIVRRASTGEVIAQLNVPYTEADAANGPLLPGQSIVRSAVLRLPDGPAGAGDLTITVETDADNTQAEGGSAEENNRASTNFASTLAAYANLQLADLAIEPAGNWTAGQEVTVRWNTHNGGNLAATGGWTERLELLNQSTGVVVANIGQILAAQNIAPGESAAHSATFTWPTGLNAIGSYRLRVVVDALSEIPEYDASGSLETDNTVQQTITVGPDMIARNVRLQQAAAQAGDTVTLLWEDMNQGGVPTPVNYQDRIVIRQRNADGSPGAIVLNSSVAFAGAAALPLAPGEVRARSFTFNLPDGLLGKLSRPGEFEIEPERWQVLDATHIRAVFDLRHVPHGLYDVTVINPDGQRVTEPYRYLVERAIEADVTIGIGGARAINPGDSSTYSVSLQSLTNVDTPYVRFNIGATDMGNYFGADSFSYRLVDAEGRVSNTATVSFTVRPVNDAPVAPAASTVSVIAGKPFTFDPLAGAIDVEGGSLSVQWVSQPAHGSLVANADGSYTYTANADYVGADTLSWRVSDGESVSASAGSIAVTVEPANVAPVARDAIVSLDEDGSLLIDFAGFGSDADGDALAVAITVQPQDGTLVRQADGRFVYTPAANFNGTNVLRFTLDDGRLVSNEGTLTLNVAAVNDAPTAADLSATLDEDGAVTLTLLSSAADVEGDRLTAAVVAGPAHGTVVGNADGSFSYRPDADYNGADSFTYRVNDGKADSNIATVALTVRPVNDAPVAQDVDITLAEDSSVRFDPLRGARDVDGDALTVAVVEGPAHGTLTVNADGSFSYVPNADFYGNDSFSYRVSDGQVSSGLASFRFEVTPVNDAPTAGGSVVTGVEDTALPLRWSDFAVRDVDSTAFTLTLTALPAEGVLRVRDAQGAWTAAQVGQTLVRAQLDAGSVRFVSAANASGGPGYAHEGYGNREAHYARLGYTVSDGQLSSAEASLTIDITAQADAPSLQLEGSVATTRELFRTGWEAAANADLTSTLVTGPVFDGWRLLSGGDKLVGGRDGFEIWHTGDRMADAYGCLRSVRAADGNGQNWLELNDAGPGQYQTLGIERTVNTVAGATYTLSFDLAGRLGFGSAHTRIAVYVDGVKLATLDRTSPTDALAWQSVSYGFTGSGGSQTVRIVSEATAQHVSGRGMMVDNIALSETVRRNQGPEDGAVLLQGLAAALNDVDGSEVLMLALVGMPVGSVLSDGVRSFTVTDAHRVADLRGWTTSGLSLRPPANFSGHLSLEVQATAVEVSTGDRATVTQTLLVDVIAVADAPTLTLMPRAESVSRELVATSWENEPNWSTGATQVYASCLQGWRLAKPAFLRFGAFEIWAANDRMRNAAGNLVTVQPAAGNGSGWLGLTNGTNQLYQSLGIEREVQTIDQAVYTLTFDYAGALGLAASGTQIGIYVDGVRIATYANTSANSALDWKALNFQFTGNGQARTVRVQLEGGNGTATQRGAMIDDIRIVETLPTGTGTVYGLADTVIALPHADAQLTDTDGSEALKLELLGLPAGAVLSDGVRSATLSAANLALDLTGWDWGKLGVKPPSGFTGTLQLQLRATSTEAGNGAEASVTREVAVKVLSGSAVATPTGVNPFVALTVQATATTAMSGASLLPQIVVSVPIVAATGVFQFATKAAVLGRRWEEKEAVERNRAQLLGDEWLHELERTAKAQWAQLVAG